MAEEGTPSGGLLVFSTRVLSDGSLVVETAGGKIRVARESVEDFALHAQEAARMSPGESFEMREIAPASEEN